MRDGSNGNKPHCMIRAERSEAFRRYSERVYGYPLVQFGTADMGQLEFMFAKLALRPGERVLDAGCGIGATTEFLSDNTLAHFTGVDNVEPVIAQARERKRDRLEFVTGDLNELRFPADSFDAVISIDSLYFVKDLKTTVGRLRGLLREGGRMGFFHSQFLKPGEPEIMLTPQCTAMSLALGDCGVSHVEVEDLTGADLRFWERAMEAAEAMAPEFEAEGNGDLAQGRAGEGKAVLELIRQGRMRRYCYLAWA